jgi:hypothetical protein
MTRASRGAIGAIASPCSLAVLCLALIALASVERRLWETDFNRLDVLGFKGVDKGKVVTLLAEIDRVPAPPTFRGDPGPATPVTAARAPLVPRPALEPSRSRAPPR